TGFVSPGILAMFLLGFFWKKTTSNAALFATIGGLALAFFLKFLPTMTDLSGLEAMGFAVPNAEGVYEIPFIDRMFITFIVCLIGMYIISVVENRRGVRPQGLEVDRSMFRPTPGFTVGALLIIGLLIALYTVYY
ncbi:MAG TPA: sodium transporter, partial [Chitinophagaceae bacterium]|nr:sodium transporter [Chitinophagaceae bacterium]